VAARDATAAALDRPLPPAREAYTIAEPYFDETRDVYAEYGLVRVKKVRLIIDDEARSSQRHFAGTTEDGKTIALGRAAVLLPPDNLSAILAHEFGHACDFLYPLRFQLRDGELVEWDHPDWSGKRGSEMDPRFVSNRRKQWEARNHDEVERTADAIAESVVKRRIYYDGPCLLQNYSGGISPRPVGLK